jgi:hypothetical protein
MSFFGLDLPDFRMPAPAAAGLQFFSSYFGYWGACECFLFHMERTLETNFCFGFVKVITIAHRCNQIWLDPPVDGCQNCCTTQVKKKSLRTHHVSPNIDGLI